jgi:membrane protease YdiL (CAAX protease family)
MISLEHIAYLTLGLTFSSPWIHRSVGVWISFLSLSLICALQSKIIEPYSLIFPLLLSLCYYVWQKPLSKEKKGVIGFIILTTVALLTFHKIPGFYNWHVEGNLWISYDKPFIGLCLLTSSIPLARTSSDVYTLTWKTLPLTILGIGGLIFLATYSGAVHLQIKTPPHLLLRMVQNLFLVTIPEEAFYRGFLQEELCKRLGTGVLSRLGAILITSLFFTLMHLTWAPNLGILGFVFIASLLYGLIYQYTKAIESSIFCHFLLNMVHLICFSYHAL